MMEIIKPKLLIVEGDDEKGLFEALLNHLSLSDIQVLSIGGKTKLRPNLKLLRITPNFDTVIALGITRDADDSPSNAFQSVCDAIRNANLAVPTKQLSLTTGTPKTAIMILPEPEIKGMLEDVCLKSFEDNPEMECVTNYLNCIKEKTGNLTDQLSKAKIHTILAAKQEPGLRLGEAAQKGYWHWDNPTFDQIKDFLRLLT